MSERSEGEGVAERHTQGAKELAPQAQHPVTLTRTVGYDHTTARRVSLGMECVECSEPFVKAHGSPTACTTCWKNLPLEERKVVLRAVHGEATKEFFRNQNRAKKAQRERE
jgi:hypothetical protein